MALTLQERFWKLRQPDIRHMANQLIILASNVLLLNQFVMSAIYNLVVSFKTEEIIHWDYCLKLIKLKNEAATLKN